MKPSCINCRHPGYWRVRAPDGHPLFVCDKCRNDWTCGHSGEEWAGHEMNLKYPLPDWVKEYDWESVEADEVASEKFGRMLDSLSKLRPGRKLTTIEKRRKKRGIPDPKLDAGMPKK